MHLRTPLELYGQDSFLALVKFGYVGSLMFCVGERDAFEHVNLVRRPAHSRENPWKRPGVLSAPSFAESENLIGGMR